MLIRTRNNRPFAAILCGLIILSHLRANASEESSNASWTVSTQHDSDGKVASIEVTQSGRLVTRVHADLRGTPAVYPLPSPSGLPLTRDFPMTGAGPLEKSDHDHHRSFWFTHGLVNDIDFWIDDDKPHVGRVVQLDATAEATTQGVTIQTTNQWRDAKQNPLLDEKRRWAFHQSAGDTIIDFETELTATDGDVTFGDTKEGSLGIRVAGSMKVDAGLGGQIINAAGQINKQAWGVASPWVDYSGPIVATKDGENPSKTTSNAPLAGITMMAHPSNTVSPTRWHVRTYGLFAANPFGRKHFGEPEYSGIVVKSGDSLQLRYRIVLHDGAHDPAQTRRHYEQWRSR
ncbi:MAG: PmoA family protein [Planctomycetota bacterium]